MEVDEARSQNVCRALLSRVYDEEEYAPSECGSPTIWHTQWRTRLLDPSYQFYGNTSDNNIVKPMWVELSSRQGATYSYHQSIDHAKHVLSELVKD